MESRPDFISDSWRQPVLPWVLGIHTWDGYHDLSHEVEELAYVVSGSGELRLEDGVVAITEGSAAFIAAEVWHTVANTGDSDLIMVFAFTSSDYPPTEHKPSRLIVDDG